MIDEDAAIIINGSIMPEFNHLKNLIFLLITFAINLKRFKLNLFKDAGYIK